jgi:galactokinase
MNTDIVFTQKFVERYRSTPRLFQAPGRVNLIGEHTDYNDGFVFPSAIDFHTRVAIAARQDQRLVIYSESYKESAEVDLANASVSSRKHWSDYVVGVAVMLRKAGYAISGANILIDSNVPLGAGLSSSAALEVSIGLSLLGIAGLDVDRKQLALLCQHAENEFVGARCGIMDQFVCSQAKSDTVLLLDCRSLDYQLLPFDSKFELVACNTMVKHELASNEYNHRRAECEEGVRRLAKVLPNVQALRDVKLSELETHRNWLTDVIYKRCHHVISENERVIQAANCLKGNDMPGFGQLMGASHRSLRDDYEVSCLELDVMVEIASKIEGVFGARMTGGGFGGCTINLVRTEKVDSFCEEVASKYAQRIGQRPEIYVSHPVGGAEEVSLTDTALKA